MSVLDFNKEAHLKEEVAREQNALTVLENKEFKRFFIEYKAELFNSFGQTKFDEPEKREEIYRQLKSLNTMEAKLSTAISTGTMAREELSRMQKLAEAAKNMIL